MRTPTRSRASGWIGQVRGAEGVRMIAISGVVCVVREGGGVEWERKGLRVMEGVGGRDRQKGFCCLGAINMVQAVCRHGGNCAIDVFFSF